ncbi:PqqD family protein [Terrisporobacter petrolearius]|uniref:PqqD family protein n=1 Tax=Terrisporobacter petrolearius TaxID=1460447 RepID=UPI001D16A6BC|nr:PqqD family protein [Terrisporobacter petrolearius]MCC3862759.1 PqqD family protein [Terrisporobacter petrolearius]
MKIKKEFCMRNICGENALVPVGETALSFKGIIKVNNIGSFIWNNLESSKNEDEIVSKVMDKYSLGLNEAKTNVDDFIKYLKNVNII